MLDLAYTEDSKADVDMNVIKTGAGLYIELQGTAEALPFGREALNRLLDLADTGIRQLIALQKGSRRPVSRQIELTVQAPARRHDQSRQDPRDSVGARRSSDRSHHIERYRACCGAGRDRTDLCGQRSPQGALLLEALWDAHGRRGLRTRHRRPRWRAWRAVSEVSPTRCVVPGAILGYLRATGTPSGVATDSTFRVRAVCGRRRHESTSKQRESSKG